MVVAVSVAAQGIAEKFGSRMVAGTVWVVGQSVVVQEKGGFVNERAIVSMVGRQFGNVSEL